MSVATKHGPNVRTTLVIEVAAQLLAAQIARGPAMGWPASPEAMRDFALSQARLLVDEALRS